ncbi:MAG: hypothetical protein IH989_06205 [Planctomycetes bacterium]|nr:hypothetical protein [Planctomycetota bacterium]
MRRVKWAVALVAGIAVSASFGGEALGQELGNGRVVITPGDMVGAGLGRAQAAVRDPFAVTPITETAETIGEFDAPDPGIVEDPADLIADAVRQLTVNAMSQLFAIIINDFLTSLGLPALFSTDFLADVPDLSSLAQADGTDQTDGSPGGEEAGEPAVPDDGTGDTGTSGGRGGRNGSRPRG